MRGSSRCPGLGGGTGTGDISLLEAPVLPERQRVRSLRVPGGGEWSMSKAEEFRVRCQCRMQPMYTQILAVYSHPLHFWVSIFSTYKDIPKAMRFGTLGEQKTLSKRTFSYILALTKAKASRQCRDATQTRYRISKTLIVGHLVHGSRVTSESKRLAKNIGGGGGSGVSILNRSITHVLV